MESDGLYHRAVAATAPVMFDEQAFQPPSPALPDPERVLTTRKVFFYHQLHVFWRDAMGRTRGRGGPCDDDRSHGVPRGSAVRVFRNIRHIP